MNEMSEKKKFGELQVQTLQLVEENVSTIEGQKSADKEKQGKSR